MNNTAVSRNDNVDDLEAARIRQALKNGKPEEAIRILGKPWTVTAPVEHGDARGRTIGFPTANMHLADDEPLVFGIYAVRVDVLDVNGSRASRHDGVANFGIRPMFRTTKPLLEAHLFDFDDDLYGKRLSVEFFAHLRSEASFSSLEALVAQIRADTVEARARLAKDRADQCGLAQDR